VNHQLGAIGHDRQPQPAQASEWFNDVIARFVQLVQQFNPNFGCAHLPSGQ